MRTATRPSSFRAAVVFWTIASGLLLLGLGLPSLRGSEDRFAEITREMILSGDYFHPRLNGESHFHKPLLSYWLIAAVAGISGVLDEFVARLPSALAGLVALGATVRLGREQWNAPVGRLAGWILLGTYGFLFWSRTAAADMENLAAVVLAVAWFRAREDRPGPLLYVGFATICAVGAQAKGLAAVVLPPLVLLPHFLVGGRLGRHLRPISLGLALVAGAIVYLGPFVWAELTRPEAHWIGSAVEGDPESGLYMVFQENVARFFAPHDHRGPIYTYVLALPILLLPWTFVFLAASWQAIRHRGRLDAETRWVAWSILLIFATFTASGSRRSYYVLPILPFCALFVAAVTDQVARTSLLDRALRWTGILLALGLAVVAVGALIASIVAPFPLVVASVVPAILVVLGWRRREGLRARLASWLRISARAVPTVVLSLLAFGTYFTVQYPMLDGFRTEKPFALALRDAARSIRPERVAFVWHVPALFPFYMEASAPITVLRTEPELQAFLAGGHGVVVASPRSLARLGGAGEALFAGPPGLSEEIHPWSSEDERYGAWFIGESGVLPGKPGG